MRDDDDVGVGVDEQIKSLVSLVFAVIVVILFTGHRYIDNFFIHKFTSVEIYYYHIHETYIHSLQPTVSYWLKFDWNEMRYVKSANKGKIIAWLRQ